MNTKLILPFLVASVVGLAACGGGGGSGGGSFGSSGPTYTGNSSPASITVDNSDELAIAGASGARQALSADSGNAPLKPGNSLISEARKQLESKIRDTFGNNTAARTEDLSSDFCDSGTVIASYSDNFDASNYIITIVFNNCVDSSSIYGYSFMWDGTATVRYSESSNTFTETFTYSNFTVEYTYNGQTETQTLNFSQTCTGDLSYTSVSCDTYSDFDGYDSRTYRVEDVSVSGDNTSGYNVNATVYDPDYGYVQVTATGIIFCTSGYPVSGTITVSDGSQTITVEFLGNCTSPQYQYTYDGTVYGPYNW